MPFDPFPRFQNQNDQTPHKSQLFKKNYAFIEPVALRTVHGDFLSSDLNRSCRIEKSVSPCNN